MQCSKRVRSYLTKGINCVYTYLRSVANLRAEEGCSHMHIQQLSAEQAVEIVRWVVTALMLMALWFQFVIHRPLVWVRLAAATAVGFSGLIMLFPAGLIYSWIHGDAATFLYVGQAIVAIGMAGMVISRSQHLQLNRYG